MSSDFTERKSPKQFVEQSKIKPYSHMQPSPGKTSPQTELGQLFPKQQQTSYPTHGTGVGTRCSWKASSNPNQSLTPLAEHTETPPLDRTFKRAQMTSSSSPFLKEKNKI